MTTFSDRKRWELLAKIDVLTDDLDQWLALSEPQARMEKHFSQIRRLDARLRPAVELLREEIQQPHVAGVWRDLERRTLELHRVWDFFRDKLALRYVPGLGDYLLAADEFAWACYEPAQRRAVDCGATPAAAVREPPLVSLTSVSTPFSIPRGASYARDMTGGAVTTPAVRALIADLPVPVVGVPWFQLRHLPDALIVGHEVGHHVFRDFALRSTVETLVHQALPQQEFPAGTRDRWLAWAEEVFADVYGVLATGSAYVLALGDFLLVEGRDPTADGATDYPPSMTRLAVVLGVLDSVGCTLEDEALSRQWGADVAIPADPMGASAVARALVTGPYGPLGDVPLSDVLECSAQCAAVGKARDVIDGWSPDTSDVRTLFALAAFAFMLNPERYTALDVTGKVLARARLLQQPGTRFKGGGTIRDDAAVRDADIAAGRGFLERLMDD